MPNLLIDNTTRSHVQHMNEAHALIYSPRSRCRSKRARSRPDMTSTLSPSCKSPRHFESGDRDPPQVRLTMHNVNPKLKSVWQQEGLTGSAWASSRSMPSSSLPSLASCPPSYYLNPLRTYLRPYDSRAVAKI